MKKICTFLAMIFAICTFAGCSAESRPLLDYQNGLETVSADFETGGAVFKIDISYGENGAEVIIKEPENISGIKLVRENGAAYAISGEMKIPLSPELFSNVDPLIDAFLLSPEKIVSITKDESGNTVYTVSGEKGVYTVFVNCDGAPLSIEYEGERTFSIDNILLQKMT